MLKGNVVYTARFKYHFDMPKPTPPPTTQTPTTQPTTAQPTPTPTSPPRCPGMLRLISNVPFTHQLDVAATPTPKANCMHSCTLPSPADSCENKDSFCGRISVVVCSLKHPLYDFQHNCCCLCFPTCCTMDPTPPC